MHPQNPEAWSGLALVCGAGGIGSAMAAELKKQCPSLTVLMAGRGEHRAYDLHLDLESDQDLERLSEELSTRNQPLRLVINCSGRLHGPNLQPEKRLKQVERRQLIEQFSINSIAPVLLAKAVEPLLHRDQPFHFASLSARVGSIGDNRSGGWYAYRAAKAAQNQLLRCLSIEWARRWPMATVTLLHPGTTDTRSLQTIPIVCSNRTTLQPTESRRATHCGAAPTNTRSKRCLFSLGWSVDRLVSMLLELVEAYHR